MEEAEVIAEGNALTTALSVIEGHGSTTQARKLVEEYQQRFVLRDHAEGYAINTALRKICGQPIPEFPQFVPSTRGTEEIVLYETTIYLWLCWAHQDRINEGLGRLTRVEITTGRNSILNVMAIDYWKSAVLSLVKGDMTTARRDYRRAAHLGSEYGTPSNPAIQWTYAASFFPSHT